MRIRKHKLIRYAVVLYMIYHKVNNIGWDIRNKFTNTML